MDSVPVLTKDDLFAMGNFQAASRSLNKTSYIMYCFIQSLNSPKGRNCKSYIISGNSLCGTKLCRLSFEEQNFTGWALKKKTLQVELAFRKFDLDRDGFLSWDEFRQVLTIMFTWESLPAKEKVFSEKWNFASNFLSNFISIRHFFGFHNIPTLFVRNVKLAEW